MSDYVCTAYQDSIFEVGERSEVGVLKDTPSANISIDLSILPECIWLSELAQIQSYAFG